MADRPAAVIVNTLFAALTGRRSPFVGDEFRLIRDAAAFLSFPAAADFLRDGLAGDSGTSFRSRRPSTAPAPRPSCPAPASAI